MQAITGEIPHSGVSIVDKDGMKRRRPCSKAHRNGRGKTTYARRLARPITTSGWHFVLKASLRQQGMRSTGRFGTEPGKPRVTRHWLNWPPGKENTSRRLS